jgi:uncharacterized protein (DUF952 family)
LGGNYIGRIALIYHIVGEKEYRDCSDGNKYVPTSLNKFGFIHCSLELSVISVANDYYSNIDEKLQLLRIDPMKLKSQTKYEAAEPEIGVGTSHLSSLPIFPHIYGPIDNSAIDGIGILHKEESSYVWPKDFISIEAYFSK